MALDENFLEHYGKKGMKWGVRKSKSGTKKVSIDAKRKLTITDKAKTHGINALTNKELKDYNNRLNLEQQFSRMQPKSATQIGLSVVKQILGVGNTVNQAVAFANSPAGKAIQENISKASRKKK